MSQLVSRGLNSVSAVDARLLTVEPAGLGIGTRRAGNRVHTSRNPIRIVIVEDQRLIADVLEAELSRQPGMVVVANLSSVHEFAARVAVLTRRYQAGARAYGFRVCARWGS